MADFRIAPPHTAPNLSTLGQLMSNTHIVTDLEQLVGPSNKPYTYSHSQDISHELATVLENHAGRAEILGVFLSNLYAETENVWLFKLFRLERFGDQNWETYTYDFESGIAEERPSQSGPPTGGWKQSKQRGQLKRYQYGVKALIDGLKDPKGQMVWYAQTVQCAQSFIRALESLCLTQLINARAFYLSFWAEAADFTVNLAARATLECATFDAFHRYQNACGTILNLVNDAFAQSQRGKVTAVIFPEGLRSLIAFDPQKQEFFRRGTEAVQFQDLGADAPSLQGKLLNTDVSVYIASPINASAQGVYKDLMKRTMESGGWTGIGLYNSENMTPEEYKSSHTTPHPFSFNKNNFKPFTALDALKVCGRFDAAGNLSPIHDRLAKEVNTIATNAGLSIVNGEIDMFLYNADKTSGPAPKAAVWGHVDAFALVPEALKWHAETMKIHLLKQLMADEYAGYVAGESLKKDIRNQPLLDEDVIWMQTIQPNTARGIAPGHMCGGPKLIEVPASQDYASITSQKGTYMTRGVGGSSAGLLVLSLLDGTKFPYIAPEVFKSAKSYWVAVEKMYDALVEIYGTDHPFLSSTYVPLVFASDDDSEWGRRYKGMLNFAYNVLDGSPPIVQFASVARANLPQPPSLQLDSLAGSRYAAFDNLRANTDAAVRDVFAKATNITALHDKFNGGPMAQAYRQYASEKARTSQVVVAVATIADPFDDFIDKEVVPRVAKGADDAHKSWIFGRLLAHIIAATNANAAYTFQTARLDGLTNDASYDAYKSALAATSTVGGANNTTFYNTRLVIDPARVYEYQQDAKNVYRNNIRIASPLNSTAGVTDISKFNAQLQRQQASQPVDLTASTISSQARPIAVPQQPRMPFSTSVSSAPPTAWSEVGIDVVTDAYGRSSTKPNENLLTRLEIAKKRKDTFVRIGAMMALMAPIREQIIAAWYEKNIYYLCDFLLIRPRKTYVTLCAIWLAIDKEVGMAAYALPDVRRGIDPIRKLVFDNWSMYLGVVITDASRIIVTPDLCIVDYKRGETLDVVLPPALEKLQKVGDDPSMYVIMQPGFSVVGPKATVPKVFSITGRFANTYAQDRNRPGQMFDPSNKPHYSSVFLTTLMYSFDKTISQPTGPLGMLNNKERKNTLVGEEKVKVYTTRGEIETMPADLIGQHVYAGVASERITGKPAQVVTTMTNTSSILPS